jgi:hypothetical protein
MIGIWNGCFTLLSLHLHSIYTLLMILNWVLKRFDKYFGRINCGGWNWCLLSLPSNKTRLQLAHHSTMAWSIHLTIISSYPHTLMPRYVAILHSLQSRNRLHQIRFDWLAVWVKWRFVWCDWVDGIGRMEVNVLRFIVWFVFEVRCPKVSVIWCQPSLHDESRLRTDIIFDNSSGQINTITYYTFALIHFRWINAIVSGVFL